MNHGGAPIELRIEWISGIARACDAELDSLSSELPPQSAASEYVFRLEPTQIARLSRPPGAERSNVARCPSPVDLDARGDAGLPACVLLRIHGDGLPGYLVRARPHWESGTERTRCATRIPVYEHPGQGALVIRDAGGARALTAYQHVQAVEL